MKKIITSLYTQPMYSCILIEPQEFGEYINIMYEYELEIFDELSKIDIFVSDEVPEKDSHKMELKNKAFTIGGVDEKELHFYINDEYIYVHWDILSSHDGTITIYVRELSSIQLKKQSIMISNFTNDIDIESNSIQKYNVPNNIEDESEYSFDDSKIRYSRTLYIEYVNNVFDTCDYNNYIIFSNLVPPHDRIELLYNGDIEFINYEQFMGYA